MDQALKPQFYLTRQNGSMVPLVPVDELPPDMSIRNVSRSLTVSETTNMIPIGVFDARHRFFVVETVPQVVTASTTSSPPSATKDNSLMASIYASAQSRSTASIYPTPQMAFGIQEQAPQLVSTLDNPHALPLAATQHNISPRIDRNAHPLPQWHNTASLPVKSAPGVKQYCSFWLRHGECDYAQQGCLYRHEMPLDQSTLESLGLRDIPRWYRERHGLGSLLAAGNGGMPRVDDLSIGGEKNVRQKNFPIHQQRTMSLGNGMSQSDTDGPINTKKFKDTKKTMARGGGLFQCPPSRVLGTSQARPSSSAPPSGPAAKSVQTPAKPTKALPSGLKIDSNHTDAAHASITNKFSSNDSLSQGTSDTSILDIAESRDKGHAALLASKWKPLLPTPEVSAPPSPHTKVQVVHDLEVDTDCQEESTNVSRSDSPTSLSEASQVSEEVEVVPSQAVSTPTEPTAMRSLKAPAQIKPLRAHVSKTKAGHRYRRGRKTSEK